jgi:DNA (cytosine-5)-methyltransferase 1
VSNGHPQSLPVLDLCGGAGGWAEGLRALGLRDIGVEIDPWACATRAAAGHLAIRADISTLPIEPFRGRISGLCGSPPCQVFSRAGQRAGTRLTELLAELVIAGARGHDLDPCPAAMVDALLPTLPTHDRKGREVPMATRLAKAQAQVRSAVLVAQPGRWIAALRPPWVALEQVPDVLPLWEVLARELRLMGYSVWTGVLNAASFGVPQTRERAFLMASLERVALPPEPTHCRGGSPAGLFGPGLLPWVSMADALGYSGSLWTNSDNNTDDRTYLRDSELPSPSLTHRVTRWTLHTNRDQREDGSRQVVDLAENPAPAFTGKSGGQWVLRNNSNANACERSLDEPAGTIFYGGRANDVSWVLTNGNQPNATRCGTDEPAPTMAFGHNAARAEWVAERPATTVCGRDQIARPGHRDRSTNGESQFAVDSVRVSVVEAAILQGIRPDYPFQGTKTKQFELVGNLVCPPVAAAVVGALAGIERVEVGA